MSEVLELSRNWSIMAHTDQDAKRIRILSDHVSKIEKENADLRAQLAEARKDRERLDYVLDHLKENTDLHNMTGHPEDNGVFLTYWGAGFAYTTHDDIDAAMKGGE